MASLQIDGEGACLLRDSLGRWSVRLSFEPA